MSETKSLCVLGRQPALGLAELESLYGPEHLTDAGGAALLDIPAEDINFKRLGGTIKTAKVLAELSDHSWPAMLGYLKKTIPGHLENLPEGKFTLGVSVYGLDVSADDINKGLLEIKKIIKKTGRPVRVVPNKTPALSSAQVLHNRLTHRGAWELIFWQAGQSTFLAQTIFVQDIEAYAARDQARPKRDSRVGMLPPKLAQILINLANLPEGARILDPFCGTGVVLQEALLMGYHVLGADIDPRLVEYTATNLRWLVAKYPQIEGQVATEVGDATRVSWPRFSGVVSEVFLGRPLNFLPAESDLKQIINDANTITKKFLTNLSGQLKAGQKVILAVPAWKKSSGFTDLPVIDHLTEMGYTYLDLKTVARQDLIYFREDQIVARRILRLEKK